MLVLSTACGKQAEYPAEAPHPHPYPDSELITQITWDWSTYIQLAPGSDNWPVTWAAGGDQYTAWGDGGGFGGTNSEARVSLGVARIEGEYAGFRPVNVWGGKDAETPGAFGGKSYGILAVGDELYMWVSPGSDQNNYDEARLSVSYDGGAAWEQAGWAFSRRDGLVLPAFAQFGPGYAGARDEYVYIYAIRLQDGRVLQVQRPGQIDLLRVPAGSLLERASYEFFAGLDPAGEPLWTAEIAERQPVFADANGVGWTVSVSYNAGLGRYLLATEHSESFQGSLGLFEAPEPWGPWSTVLYESAWEGRGANFFWNFSNKWTSPDGKEFVLVFSGTGEQDAWNSVQGRFITGEE